MQARRVVVTGIGALTPIGNNLDSLCISNGGNLVAINSLQESVDAHSMLLP